MQDAKVVFAQRLREAMMAAGYAPKPSVLEREFNTRHWGKPMSLHGVRRWLRGETMPDLKKLQTLADWLKVPVQELCFGAAAQTQKRPQPWHAGFGYQDRELFEVYLRLPVPQRRLVRELILMAAQAAQAADRGPPPQRTVRCAA